MSWQGPPPSMLSDVLKYVKALFEQAGDSTEFYTGERFLGQEGAPPRVVFVPVRDMSTLGPPREIGARQIGTIREAARCYVWGAETVSDDGRYDAARRLVMRLMAAFKAAAPGRLLMGELSRGDATNIVTFGEEYQAVIGYEWAVPQDRAIARAAQVLGGPPRLPPDPDRPEGDTGFTFTKTVVTEVP